jgi:hypothetical protein
MDDIDRPPGGSQPGRWLLAILLLLAVIVGVTTLVDRGADPRGQPAGVTHPSPLVDPDEIVPGGPPPDGIPPIDEPRFQPLSEVDWLSDRQPVVALEVNDDARAYPLQILTWHEIVNDEVGGQPVAVTYCPLCNTPVVWKRPLVEGGVTTFGTSGMLYRSNLVMYDRTTESYWPQLTGQAVTGPLTGRTLELVPAQIVSFGDFRATFPEGRVLSRDTGFDRPYGTNPYPGYDRVDDRLLFRGDPDPRLSPTERVIGVTMSDDAVAFPYSTLQRLEDGGMAAVNTEVGGEPVVVVWKPGTISALDRETIERSRDVGAGGGFSRRVGDQVLTFEVEDGRLVDTGTGTTWNVLGHAVEGPLAGQELSGIAALDSFWFDWAAFHPQTEIWSR